MQCGMNQNIALREFIVYVLERPEMSPENHAFFDSQLLRHGLQVICLGTAADDPVFALRIGRVNSAQTRATIDGTLSSELVAPC